MKLCFACQEAFESVNWICPSCQWSPDSNERFVAYSPELVNTNAGMRLSVGESQLVVARQNPVLSHEIG